MANAGASKSDGFALVNGPSGAQELPEAPVPTRIPVRTTFDNWPKRARLLLKCRTASPVAVRHFLRLIRKAVERRRERAAHLLREGLPAAGRLGPGLEQPEAAHARPPQVLARLRGAPRSSSSDFLAARGFLREVVPGRRGAGRPGTRALAVAGLSRRWPTSAGRAGGTAGRRCRGRRAWWPSPPPSGRRSPRRWRRRAAAARRSDSSRANRQLRTCPSAVSRTRSQSPQNGRVTEAITPTVAGPPSTRNSSAGALPRGSVAGRQHELLLQAGEDLVGRHHLHAGSSCAGRRAASAR